MQTGSGIAIGVALGVALGAALGNVGMGLAIGISIGVALDALYASQGKKKQAGGGENSASSRPPINPVQVEAKAEHLAKVLALAKEKGSIGNDDVQHSLGVSDATAERYLDELEKEGKLEQFGDGRGIKYRLK